MSITGINQSTINQSLLDLYGTQSSASTTSTSSSLISTLSTDSTSSSDTISISEPAEIYSRFQKLKASDPEKFKKVCTDIANKLKAVAQKRGDGYGGNTLSSIAANYQSVADGGDISLLNSSSSSTSTSSTSLSGVSYYSQKYKDTVVDALKKLSSSGKFNGSIDEVINLIKST